MYPDVGCEQLPLLPPAAGVVAPHGAEDAAGVVRGVGGVVGLPGRLPPHGGLHIVQLTLPSPAQPSPPCHCSRSECCTGETGSGWSRHTIWTQNIEI